MFLKSSEILSSVSIDIFGDCKKNQRLIEPKSDPQEQTLLKHIAGEVRVAGGEADRVVGDLATGRSIVPTVEVIL